MKHVVFLLLIMVSISCNQKKQPILGETEFQREMNAMFKDASKSPLKDKDRKSFRGLDFFEYDSTFVVQASLQRTPDSPWFEMKTTTERVTSERIYGVVSFDLQGKKCELNVYQSQEDLNSEDYKDNLFLPFLDNTNGEETYGGGRYLDLRIPEGDLLEIDFNRSYNPYCTYNPKYSCPIVPRVNYIDVEVKAGVKDFHKK